MSPMIVKADYTEAEWLARNIYHEARGEGIRGMVTIALITINRVEDSNYPNTIKGVVTQPNQFTWYNRKKIKSIKKNNDYHMCLAVSKMSISLWKSKKIEKIIRQTGLNEVLWYHNIKEKPRWAKHKDEIAQIGKHQFYRDI